ncbi:MAG: hypothetical protein B5M52_06555 [Helicobacteraceae bacterium 4484_230]|nr:MAG: hypothetical protein B5M52_06555 [Helicobacteraceae bacterium 4484_230]
MKPGVYICLIALALMSVASASQNTTSIRAQYEMKDFKNSKQKTEGTTKTLTLKQLYNAHLFKAAYERTDTETKPYIPKDLEVKKLFARYGYRIDGQWGVYGGYIAIDDNLVSTDGGKIYSLGVQYAPSGQLEFAMTGYYGDYDIMKTFQIDAKMLYRYAFGEVKSRSVIIVKQINIDDCQEGSICSNAKNSYLTPGFIQSLVYHGYFATVGAFFGKRVFAVMHDGFKVQHHAMEFDKTMMAALGKRFESLELMLKYVYQEAEELPMKNSGVEVRNTVIMLGYRF